MPNPFERGKRSGGLKAPTFDIGGQKRNPLELLMARELLSREEERRKPELAGETAEATDRAKRKFAVENSYNNLRNDFIQMRDLTLQVENSAPGIMNRLRGGTKNYISLMRQDPTGAMLSRHQNIVNSSLRNMAILRANETESRFSNDDAIRMASLFGNPVWDSEIKEDLDFAENSRTLDDRASSAGVTISERLFDKMFPDNIQGMTGRKGASKILLGDLIRDRSGLDDIELGEGIKRIDKFQSIKKLSPVLQQIILEELDKRGLDI